MPYRPTGGPPGRPPHPGLLTPAELRVLQLVREGLTTPQISVRLGISEETVHTHISRMFSKLGVRGRTELARWQPPADATPVGYQRWWAALPLGLVRRTRTSLAWAFAAAAVLASVIGVVVLLLTTRPVWDASGPPSSAESAADAPPTATETPVPPPTRLVLEDYDSIRPGVYFIDPDGNPSTTTGATLVIKNTGWIGSRRGVNFNEAPYTMHLKLFVEPFIPVCGHTIVTPGLPLPPGSKAADLAQGVATSGLTVAQPAAPVKAFGQDGYHVVVAVPEDCRFGGEGTPHIWIGPGDVMEVWAFDMNGSVVMVEALWLTAWRGSVADKDMDVLNAVIDSVVLAP